MAKKRRKISFGKVALISALVLVVLFSLAFFTGFFQSGLAGAYVKTGVWQGVHYTAFSDNEFGSSVFKKYSEKKDWWYVNTVVEGDGALHADISYSLSGDNHCYAFDRGDGLCVNLDGLNLQDVKSVSLTGKVSIAGNTYKSSAQPSVKIGVVLDGQENVLFSSIGKRVRVDSRWSEFSLNLVNPKIVNTGDSYVLSDYNGDVLGTVKKSTGGNDSLFVCIASVYSQGCSSGQALASFTFSSVNVEYIKPQPLPVTPPVVDTSVLDDGDASNPVVSPVVEKTPGFWARVGNFFLLLNAKFLALFGVTA